jgi:mono/diheme cytochrome c family protein
LIRLLFSTVLALAAFGPASAGAAAPDPAPAATPATTTDAAEDALARGEYVFRAASCAACHTRKGGAFMAGGRALETPFGTFYSPNLTPDPQTGIGNWTFEAFARALRHGLSPEGKPYYPAFPFTSYAAIADQDLADLWTYLRSVTPVHQENRPHDLAFPFSQRSLLWGWRWLNFQPVVLATPAGASEELRRGAYLVEVLGHCQECHTPRNLLGASKSARAFAGNPDGPEGDRVPNITPDPQAGIGNWNEAEIVSYLKTGMTPDFDFAGSAMREVIDESTSKLTDADRTAIAGYLKSIAPLPKK